MYRRTPPFLRLACAAALLAGAACGRTAPPAPVRSVELDAGRSFASALSARLEDPSRGDAVAAGYLARLRLGLGSPFRLAEYALRDPRLTSAERRATAWALLAATADGEAYGVDPAAFGAPERGSAHLAAIRESIRTAPDPRSGEAAVRLAYQLAEAEGTVGPGTRRTAERAAGLLRHREQAREDVAELLEEAGRAGGDPLTRLVDWRRARRFRTERPLTGPEAVARDDAAMRRAPAALARVRAAEATPLDPAAPAPATLTTAAARRLRTLNDSMGPPPRPAVVVPLRQLEGPLVEGVPRGDRRRLAALARSAAGEEDFVAGHALAGTALEDPRARTALARTTLEVALALAAHGQERVWHPGMAGPTVVDLQWRFGIDSVTFSRRVPARWHPYLLLALEGALTDWQEAFPPSTLRGVHVRFGGEGVPPQALAIHSPRSGTIRLPPATGLGNLAHELAHEMDRAESERRYGLARRYATDDAVHRGRRDAFAAASRGIVESRGPGGVAVEGRERAYLNRPAEIFARSVDRYVAAALADRGRMNGDLSALPHESGLEDPEPSGDRAAEALTETLLLMTPLPEADLRRFTARHAPALSPRPAALAEEIVRAGRLLPVPLPRDPATREAWLAAAARELLRVREAAAAARAEHAGCRPGDQLVIGLKPAPDARLALIGAAEDAGARRVVRHFARLLAGRRGPAWLEAWPFAPGAPHVDAETATWLRRLAALDPPAPPEPAAITLLRCAP